jgi:hypothetical protein
MKGEQMNSRDRRAAEKAEYAAWAARQGLNTPSDWQRRKRQLELDGITTLLKILAPIILFGVIMTLIFG